MQYLKWTLLTLLATLLIASSTALAFSFDFGDGDDYYYRPWWGGPYGQPYYQPWRPYFYPPQLPSFDRHEMVRERQNLMDDHMDAMEMLKEQLYGDYGFDRAEAIRMARKIELTSGTALTRNFHPGAVRQSDSRTTPNYWGNEQTFKANAEALRAAAADLANELAKKPTAKEGAVFLTPRFREDNDAADKTAVSPAIWEKFNTLSNTCESCHRSFRGRRWW